MKALITGASSGIGKEIAGILAHKGIDLVIASRSEAKMMQLKDELIDLVQIDYIVIDLANEKSALELFNKVKQNNHKIDILVNNSGFGLFGKNSELAHEMIEKMIILNAVSTTSLCRLYGNEMAKNGLGYILNVASTAAYQPIPYFAAYSASKSYLMNFSKALHHELKHSNVKVTCLNPGPTETNFFEIALNGKKFPAFNLKPMMSAKEVAQVGIDAMFDGKTVVVAGTLNYIFSKILPFIPLTIVERFLTIFAKDKFISANT